MPKFDGSPYTELTEIADDDLFGVLKDISEADPASQTKFAKAQTVLRAAQTYQGYKITPTVLNNDLVLTVTHMDGTTPSASRPLWFKIGNNWRACVTALSVTKADGISWASLGSALFGGKEQDLFPYVCWNTNLATAAVDLFWSRVPYARLYSDLSATTTNEKYAAINVTAPAATDECALIGRFAATLSLTGTGHLWTVPTTYTNSNLYNVPVYETEWRYWEPAPTGFSAPPTNVIYLYKIIGKECLYRVREATAGTSNANTFTYTAPFTAATLTNMVWSFVGTATDNGATVGGSTQISSGGAVITCFPVVYAAGSNTWTATAVGKRMIYSAGQYPIAL